MTPNSSYDRAGINQPPPPPPLRPADGLPVRNGAANPPDSNASPMPSGIPQPIPAVANGEVAAEEAGRHIDITERAVRSAPPWLFSAVFHFGIIIILGLMLLPLRENEQINLDAAIYAEEEGHQLEFDSPLAGLEQDNADEPIFTPDNLPEVDDPFATPTEVNIVPEGMLSTDNLPSPQIGLALKGRSEGMKKMLLGRYGGDATTEAAVAFGLAWLAGNQNTRDGSWSLTGPYRSGGNIENKEAATAMALLAFQGAGNTHKEGKYQKNVARAWDWLLKQQDEDGCFFHGEGFNHRFYTQGQCTIAICELLGMTGDERFREPAERAIEYCVKTQSPRGGWKYRPNGFSDVSVTGWIVMAMQSAKMAGIDVPSECFQRVEKYLDTVGREDGSRYPYEHGQMVTPAMTAEALLCRQYMGWKRDDSRLRKGVDYITLPEYLVDYSRNRNIYFWYYATQVTHHMEGDWWKRWNGAMRQAVPKEQIKGGKEKGSWEPNMRDGYERSGGRLYVTCLSIYMLEVYYRHLPIYTKVY
ncbi:MAG: terpene cyclase/mutase family protein [Pirellulales bacterium]|nr:terpene cyclase/mutase family protein [Pirellulales bacterium]